MSDALESRGKKPPAGGPPGGVGEGEEQPAASEAVLQEFGARRNRQLAVTAVLLPMAFAAGWFSDEQGSVLGIPAQNLILVFAVVVLGAGIYSWRNWRCPACEKSLGKGLSPRFCPNCGVGLRRA